jgi:hypothetical protein
MKYKCNNCIKYYKSYKNLWTHNKSIKLNNEITKIKSDINLLKNKYTNTTNSINNHLIDIISDKNKKIEELIHNKVENQQNVPIETKSIESLILNDIIITSRSEDNYINATQLCQAGCKKFNDWYRLNTTKQLINHVKSETEIPVSQLIDIKKRKGSWIHPDLAIQLAQWISPKFAIQVSKWIRELFTNGKVEINLQLVNEIKLKDQEIKLLKNTYMKKHKRVDYPEQNVIYILTTESNLKDRIYIIGKTKNLKNRLSTYNKTCDHQVVYYKGCASEEIMNLVELTVLNKLKQYQEIANRDRFILPIGNDISLFTNIIENCINFLQL